jgi:5-methyltetrahydrofolate--homocysteine methyltransferase
MRTALETRPAADKPSLDEIVAKVGAFSSDSDGTGDADATPQRTRRSRRRIVA